MRALSLRLDPVGVRTADDVDGAFVALVEKCPGCLIRQPLAAAITGASGEGRLPICPRCGTVDVGGMSYGVTTALTPPGGAVCEQDPQGCRFRRSPRRAARKGSSWSSTKTANARADNPGDFLPSRRGNRMKMKRRFNLMVLPVRN